jgi:TolB-like protein
MALPVVLCLVALAAAPEKPAAADPATPQKPRLVVNEFVGLRVAPEEASAVSDAVVTYLAGRGLFEVLGPRDIQTLLGADRQRQLLGTCEADAVGCSLDLSKLVSARFVLSGQLARVGTAYQLTLQMVDTERTQTSARSSKLAGSLEAIRDLVPYAASEATGSPLPPPPSRALPITLLIVGGATVLSGAGVEVLALSREAQLNDELCPGGVLPDGRCAGVSLKPRDFYVQQQSGLTVQKIVGIGVMAAGAVLLGLGVWLMPPDDARTRISARLVPTPNGFAVTGGFW